jgi:hypothetical protein
VPFKSNPLPKNTKTSEKEKRQSKDAPTSRIYGLNLLTDSTRCDLFPVNIIVISNFDFIFCCILSSV